MSRIITILFVLMLGVINYSNAEVGAGKKMEITSPDFMNNEYLPERAGYNFNNVNPELNIGNIPDGTKSLVLIVDDPDAPGGTWVHWVMYDMPVVHHIGPGGVFGKQGINDFKNTRYDGPCPPSGTHRYFFKAYALDTKLGLPAGQNKASVEKAMKGHVIEEAEIIGLYKK